MRNDFQIAQFKKLLASRREQDIEAQISEAEQIVHAIEKVDSVKAFAQVHRRIQRPKRVTGILHVFTRVAAILFVPLLVTSLFFFYRQGRPSADEQFSTHVVSNPRGVRSQIVLPDGSKVWLNAESSISYKIPFDVNVRNIKLTGEAFFEVEKDKQRPFRVESGKVDVMVLGTRFNCKAFPEDTIVEVVLAEGSVKLNSTGSSAGKEFILKPGERAVINNMTSQATISSENIAKYISWHEGKIVFDECPLSEVARRLERWFGTEVTIEDPEISNYQISTTFENESLRQIGTLLELASPIKIELIPARFERTSQTMSREKVIITKNNKPQMN
jgi:ferric-dicitrate binding protein FerR (iron transport regulator)